MIAFLFTLFVFSSCEGEREREREERDARKFHDATLNSFFEGEEFSKKRKKSRGELHKIQRVRAFD